MADTLLTPVKTRNTLSPYDFSGLHDLARARRQVDTWTSSERGIALSDGQAEFYDKDEAKRRFEAALRGARISGHKPKMDIPKKHLDSQVARAQDQ